jgi:hypothetical protein
VSVVPIIPDVTLYACNRSLIENTEHLLSDIKIDSFCGVDFANECGIDACGVVNTSINLIGFESNSINSKCTTLPNASVSVSMFIEGDFLAGNISKVVQAANLAAVQQLLILETEAFGVTSNFMNRMLSSTNKTINNSYVNKTESSSTSGDFVLETLVVSQPVVIAAEMEVMVQLQFPANVNDEIGVDNTTLANVMDILLKYKNVQQPSASPLSTTNLLTTFVSFNTSRTNSNSESGILGIVVGLTIGSVTIIVVSILVVIKVWNNKKKIDLRRDQDHIYNEQNIQTRIHTISSKAKLTTNAKHHAVDKCSKIQPYDGMRKTKYRRQIHHIIRAETSFGNPSFRRNQNLNCVQDTVITLNKQEKSSPTEFRHNVSSKRQTRSLLNELSGTTDIKPDIMINI